MHLWDNIVQYGYNDVQKAYNNFKQTSGEGAKFFQDIMNDFNTFHKFLGSNKKIILILNFSKLQ